MKQYKLVLIFLLTLIYKLPAQDIIFKRYAPPGDIYLGNITGITQDKSGYLWFTSSSGLHRFDGYTLKTYFNDPVNSNSLGSNLLESICADKNGIIWIGMQGYGLDRFDPATGIFTHFRHIPADTFSLIHDKVTVVLQDREGIFWIGTHGGLDRFDAATGKFTHYRRDANDPTSLSCDQVRSIYEDRAGTIWVGTGSAFPNDDSGPNDGGLNRLDKKTGRFTRYLNDPRDPHSLINNKVCGILEDSRGNFWVGTAGDGLHTMDRTTGKFERHLYDPAHPEKLSRPPISTQGNYDHIRFIVEDAAGYVWIGAVLGGLNRYDPVTGKVARYEGIKNASGVTDNTCWSAYNSREGVLWVSALDIGAIGWKGNLYHHDPIQKTIPYKDNRTLSWIYLAEDSNITWQGTSQGLIYTDKGTGFSKLFTNDPADTSTISNNIVLSMYKDRQGIVWIGTGNGFNRFNKDTKDFTRFMHDEKNPGSIADARVFAITEDNMGSIWLATQAGLENLDVHKKAFTHYRNNPEDSGSLGSNWVFTLHRDGAGNIWVGCLRGGGLNLLNQQTGKFKRYLMGSSINSLLVDSDSVMWAGTSGGLYRYNQAKDEFSLFADPAKNLKIETVNLIRIEEDKHKNLWMSSSIGIIKLNAARNKFSIYSSSHGVNANNLIGFSFTDPNGKLFFMANTGHYSFFPDSISSNNKPPQIILSGLQIGDKLILPGPGSPLKQALNETTAIRLDHTQNQFSIDFAGIHFTDPENNKHLFMLDNYDKSWHQSGTEHTAYYYKIPPGQYTFRVKASSSNMVWVEKSIDITIIPPLWQRWWAYCVYGLLFIAGIYAVHRIQKERVISKERERTRNHELAQAKEIEKSYEALKTTQAQLIHQEKMASLGELTAGIAHEIQNPLNFVNNFSEVNKELLVEMKDAIDKGDLADAKAIADDVIDNQEKINHHGKRADSIVKGMLQHSRETGSQKEPTDINKLAGEYLRLAYHGLRAKDKSFNVTIKTDYDENLGKVNIISQDMGRVMLNLINNAFYAVEEKRKSQLNGYDPTVSISTKKLDGKVEISVKDNGNGIPQKVMDKIFQPFFTTKPTGQGTGLGLSLSYDVVKAHSGEIKVNTKEGEGTEFIILLPTT